MPPKARRWVPSGQGSGFAILPAMKRKTPQRNLLFCLFAFIVASAPLRAQEAKEEAATAPVRVEGRRLFEVTASGTATATQRAARINRRLQQLVERPRAVPPFTPRDVLLSANAASFGPKRAARQGKRIAPQRTSVALAGYFNAR